MALQCTLGVAPVVAMSQGSWVGLVVVLMLAGLAFLMAEIFVIPGFGIAGIVGVGALVAGVSLAWVQFGALPGMGLLALSILATVVSLWIVFKTNAGKRLLLNTSLKDAVAVSDDGLKLMGATGEAVTMLRPSGSAEFAGERVEVETEGEFIPKGTRVRVVAVEMGRVVVEEAMVTPDSEI
mgnify:CR=1 FL=1